MLKKSSITRRGLLGALCALGTGARPRSAAAAAPYTMRYNIAEAPGSFFAAVAEHFASGVKARSDGQLTIEVYTSGQLASQQASIDMVASGALDFTKQGTSFMVPMIPAYQLFDLPFLFPDLATAYRVADGPIGKEIASLLEPRGLVGLAWEVSGMKAMETTTKAIVSPEDMKGLRIRIAGGPVYVATYQALGAVPVVIDINEAFTALAQHTIDGLDLSVDSFAAGKWYTVAKHVAISNHVVAMNPMIGSKKNIEALPAGLQRIVRDEARAMDLFARTLIDQRLSDAMQISKNNGVAFTEVQRAAFRKAMDPVYASAKTRLGGDLIDRVGRAAAAPARR